MSELWKDIRIVLPYIWSGLFSCLFSLLMVSYTSQRGGWSPLIGFLFFGAMVVFAYTMGAITTYYQGRIDGHMRVLKAIEQQQQGERQQNESNSLR